jgi:hypothetical protein
VPSNGTPRAEYDPGPQQTQGARLALTPRQVCMRYPGLMVALFLFWLPVQAATVRLFNENGSYPADYAQRVDSVRAGDLVQFSGGHSFVVDAILGSGSHTIVFSLRGADGRPTGKAIRVSTSAGRHPLLRQTTYADILSQFAKTSELLETNGVLAVKVYREESRPSEFVVVEKLDIAFNYQHFLNGTGGAARLDAAERHRALRDFVTFARSLAMFRTIGDQLPEQIGYVKGRGWVLFDYNGHGTSLANTVGGASPFMIDYAMYMAQHGSVMEGNMLGGGDERLPLPSEIRAEVHAMIEKDRLRAGLPEGFCKRAMRFLGRAIGGLFTK